MPTKQRTFNATYLIYTIEQLFYFIEQAAFPSLRKTLTSMFTNGILFSN